MQQRYPGVEVIGTQYPIPEWKQQLARVLSFAQMSSLAVVLMGEKAFEFMGVPTPVWYTTNIAPNKMGWAVGIWFMGNMAQGALTQTNAFEIYANGELVYSKLQTGRLPNYSELFTGLARTGLRSWEEVVAEEALERSQPQHKSLSGVAADEL